VHDVRRDVESLERALVAVEVDGRRRFRKRWWVGHGDAGQASEQLAVDRPVHLRGGAAVGQQRYGEVGLRSDLQERGLPQGVAAVAEEEAAVPVVEAPTEAPLVAEGGGVGYGDLR